MLLSLRALSKTRMENGSSVYTLKIPCFEVVSGDKIVITGPSGSGKSTVLDMLGLILTPDPGGVFQFAPRRDAVYDILQLWRRRDLTRLARLRAQLGYVLQTGGLLPFLSARQNLNLHPGPLSRLPLERLARQLGIFEALHKMPGQLSVGERQRVAIARAIICRPLVVLADEPTAALDPHHAKVVMDIFANMVDEYRLTLIMVTHDPALSPPGARQFAIEASGGAPSEAVLREVV
jgi:putative ABC transport system ATP-binding protein